MVKEKVKQIVERVLGIAPGDYRIEEHFETDLGADSLDFVDVIMECEREFEIRIPDDALPLNSSVQDLINYIESHLDKD